MEKPLNSFKSKWGYTNTCLECRILHRDNKTPPKINTSPIKAFLKKVLALFIAFPSLTLGIVGGIVVFIVIVRIPILGTIVAPILGLGTAWFIVSKLTTVEELVEKSKSIFGKKNIENDDVNNV